MEFEYSNDVKGKVIAYQFDTWEMETIATALKPVVKKLDKKIERVRNHPKNEGQVRYAVQIDELYRELKALEFIINTFSITTKSNQKNETN